jgi:hypothetical protein
MAGIQTIKVNLQRDSLQTPWGFRLQGGADFRSHFIVNKISAGSPADGVLHRGDVILEIDQRPISSLLHAEALELVQRAGGQITFLVQRGPSPLASFIHPQRPMSAMPWSLANATSYLDKNFTVPWSPPAATLSPMSCYRSRPLERIADPKPVLSQTGSPLMPGPVPSVSTKTRGYIQPPIFHTERNNLFNTTPADASYSPTRFTFPGSYNNPNQTVSTTAYQNSYNTPSYQPAWKDSLNNESNTYVPSYQKKVQVNPTIQRPISNGRPNQRNQQQYTTIPRQQQQQNYRPASAQPIALVHRQFNSPMALYSNDNVQDVVKSHVSHITRVSLIPSVPKPERGSYTVSVTPSSATYTTASTPICYIKPIKNLYGSNF